MDPVQGAIASLLNAAQAATNARADAAVAAPGIQPSALLALIGQDVTLVFLGVGADGQKLTLPSGQVVSAQGDLPYPDGTQLLVRFLAGSTPADNLRLQILEATPPAPAAILAPLLQGEGAALLGRLQQGAPAPELAPLAELFTLLKTPTLPQPSQLQAALATLPAPVQEALRAMLQAGPEAAAVAAPPPGAPLVSPAAIPVSPTAAPVSPTATLEAALATWLAKEDVPPEAGALVQALVQRLQTVMDRHPDVPAATKDTLVGWLKALVSSAVEVADRKAVVPPQDRTVRPKDAPAQVLQTLLSGRAGAPAEAPETWQSWIKAAVKTLSDPVASPREAPFHAAQAKEGTAFFEIPLPWSPQNPLQMWVESDQEGKGGGPKGETRTVLLGLKFTRLGETRLGIAKGPAGLQVRVWTEHPELFAPALGQVEEELKALGTPVDLKVLPLQPGPGGYIPSLRSLVTGPTLEVLG
jgi:hypothetical protein